MLYLGHFFGKYFGRHYELRPHSTRNVITNPALIEIPVEYDEQLITCVPRKVKSGFYRRKKGEDFIPF